MHKKLAEQDEEPVKLLMAQQFSAYYENLDVPLQEACCKALLQQRWTFESYALVLEQYVDCEKNKFECDDSCLAAMDLNQQDFVKTLLPRLKSNDTGLVKVYFEQQWQAYSANLDCVVSSTRSLEALKGDWMQNRYVHCLQTYVDSLARPMSSIGSPSRGEKRSLARVIPCSPGSSKKPISQVGPSSPGAAGK